MNSIKIVIVDDHQIVRDGIRAMLLPNKNIKIVGEAADYDGLMRILKVETPDVIILDISLPGKSGIEITRELIEGNNETKILILSANTDEESIIEVIKAGAKGFLPKDTSKDEFLVALNLVYNEEGYFGEKLSKIIYKSYIQHVKSIKSPEQEICLSEREIEIIKLLAEGITSKEIADRLFISSRTVETHKNNIIKKLNLKNLVELLKYAIKHGIVKI
jgi:DNA-binding NarL/FixJ family response regulator